MMARLGKTLALGILVLATVAAAPVRHAPPPAKLTLAEAQRLADTAPPGKFPLVVTPGAFDQIHRWTATRQAREHFREVLSRLDGYRGMIEGKFSKHRIPVELLAIPVVESGYRNLPPDEATPTGAGLWMLVMRTARRYGLRIGEKADERLHEEKATEAAARYLSHLYTLFHSWPLALTAYNRGEGYVKERILTSGTRDAWQLEPGETDYLDKTMAAAFLLRHPRFLD